MNRTAAALGIGLLALGMSRCTAHAQEQDDAPATVLARVCAKEAGFTGYADCGPIAAVLLRVGRGDVVRGARLHSRRVFDPIALGRRPWIAYLRADGAEPRDWPQHLSWRAHRPAWLRLMGLARSLVSTGDARPGVPCEPDTWGGAMDRERARRLRLVRIDCGPTVNDFYVRPPRSVPARLAAGARR